MFDAAVATLQPLFSNSICDHHTYAALFRVAFIARVSSTYVPNTTRCSRDAKMLRGTNIKYRAHQESTRYERISSIVDKLSSPYIEMNIFYVTVPVFFLYRGIKRWRGLLIVNKVIN